MGGAHQVEELLLERTNVRDGELVEVAGGAGEDSADLLLERKRLVLALLEELGQERAAVEQLLGGGVEVRVLYVQIFDHNCP